MISVLAIITPQGEQREILRHRARPGLERLEAPNWSPCGSWLLVNGGGLLWQVPLQDPRLIPLSTGIAARCNNDHGFTRDGRILFGSHYEGLGAQIYAMPVAGLSAGAVPEKISSAAPSWWHGLSPDGQRMVYPAVRGEGREVNIFSRDLAGGAEQQLTRDMGHNDGPDFSADGRQIFWNSDQSGWAQIWRMEANGSGAQPLFLDDRVNWFPHPSPCGAWLCWISYPPGTEGHPADLQVELMLSDAQGQDRRVLQRFTGGQGSLNVPCWAPDSRAFAFIRYEL